MTGFLIGEEGPLSGLTVNLEEGETWVLGRDPDTSQVVLEDPMVSRKHAQITKTPDGFLLENFSTVNPVTQNGKVLTETVSLKEGDILHIGSTYFRFTQKAATKEGEILEAFPDKEGPIDIKALNLGPRTDARWLLKVISGPNAGAESGLYKGDTLILGKDPAVCDILFQDLSVSKQHARLSIDMHDVVSIEDLNSRNGVLVNGKLIEAPTDLNSQDLVALGTTTFLVIDREEIFETIVAKAPVVTYGKKEEKAPVRTWKDIVISTRHLFVAGAAALFLIAATAGLFSLFKAEPVIVSEKNEVKQIQEKLERFPAVQFSYNLSSGKLFLVGHLLTSVDRDEMLYLLHTLSFIEGIDDNVVVDELVWENMNALLATNPSWEGVSIHASTPGYFVLNGYLESTEQLETLTDYINLNFPYLDRLDNQVVIENNLKLQISQLLEERNLNGVQFDVKNGEIILAGRVDEQGEEAFHNVLKLFNQIRGVRRVDNFVVMTKVDTSLVDLSQKYKVSGYSKKDNRDFYVVIEGKILGKGDLLDGMMVTMVDPQKVVLEKDGIKYQINYNQQ